MYGVSRSTQVRDWEEKGKRERRFDYHRGLVKKNWIFCDPYVGTDFLCEGQLSGKEEYGTLLKPVVALAPNA